MFAVLLQLAVAATHHHADALGGPLTLSGEKALVAAPDDGPPPAAENECTICLGLTLGTTFIVPPAIALGLLQTAGPAPGVIERELEARTRFAFKSRAPPQRL
jgi:hypothetical protein